MFNCNAVQIILQWITIEDEILETDLKKVALEGEEFL